mgnify:CR=1 FL=1
MITITHKLAMSSPKIYIKDNKNGYEKTLVGILPIQGFLKLIKQKQLLDHVKAAGE